MNGRDNQRSFIITPPFAHATALCHSV